MAMFSNAWQSFSKIYWWEVFFTMFQCFGMKTRFMLESALYGTTNYVRSIPNMLSVEELPSEHSFSGAVSPELMRLYIDGIYCMVINKKLLSS